VTIAVKREKRKRRRKRTKNTIRKKKSVSKGLFLTETVSNEELTRMLLSIPGIAFPLQVKKHA
jgi:hypothetical protein